MTIWPENTYETKQTEYGSWKSLVFFTAFKQKKKERKKERKKKNACLVELASWRNGVTGKSSDRKWLPPS